MRISSRCSVLLWSLSFPACIPSVALFIALDNRWCKLSFRPQSTFEVIEPLRTLWSTSAMLRGSAHDALMAVDLTEVANIWFLSMRESCLVCTRICLRVSLCFSWLRMYYELSRNAWLEGKGYFSGAGVLLLFVKINWMGFETMKSSAACEWDRSLPFSKSLTLTRPGVCYPLWNGLDEVLGRGI